ncbi:hypothetical protein [Chryseobacterium sp.]|uniref:hypothetical protein n=1 Tax=Chryseobacterium sp. TaxID=1871047 RepID=UPI00289DA7CC|nr:hypothetical protein [Chryseobacterium sp.]
MDAKDLRIGNLITRQDLGTDEPRTETILELRKDKVFTSGPLTVICDYEDINPVPLTDELLTNFGFEKDNDSKYRLTDSDEEVFYITLGEDPTFCMDNVGILHYIDYVHELQNIYYVLGIKDLELISKN